MELSIINYAIFAFGALVSILNPFGILPQYIAYTASLNHQELVQTTKIALKIAGTILVAIGLIGSAFLGFFNISIPAFKITGGIILFSIAFKMLFYKDKHLLVTTDEFQEGVNKEDISVFPLAIPLIAGPGSITTVVMLEDRASSLLELGVLSIEIIICIMALYFILTQAEKIKDKLGVIGINVITRIMGLILSAIAVQFIIDSVDEITIVKLFGL
ncbi:MarC family protein [Legionella spiritensis]|uniref:MarC family protein n=1 Tax=Legionella spiritensis TaxID=452 RepID=UPI000F6C4659|nr:MarC family protein [Legionella spiritensis]VEG92506.1 Multiple antibiotic resistance (MarC)-related protein [Legionella spiritensis]